MFEGTSQKPNSYVPLAGGVKLNLTASDLLKVENKNPALANKLLTGEGTTGGYQTTTPKQVSTSMFGGIVQKVQNALKNLGSVDYTRPAKQGPIYPGGTRANRNNNPLNIKASQYTMSYSGISGLDPSPADDGGQFLRFNSIEDGFNAAKRLITTEGYLGLTVDQALKRWSNNGYGGEIVPYLKNKVVGQLSPKELEQLVIRMADHEGFEFNHQGKEVSQVTPSARGRNYLGIVTTMPFTPTRYEQSSPGIDIANRMGTPIPAFTGGIVVAVDYGKSQGDKGYGNFVIVKDKDGNQHRYSHLQKGYVKVGDQISRGQVLGAMGNTGSTYSESGGDATHLDYRIVSAYGKYLNPLTYVKNFASNVA